MTNLKCRSCGFEGLKRFLSLGNIPPVNAFIDPADLDKEKSYPLNLAYCPVCFLVQLEEIVPPSELFSNYLHLSAGSASNINHLKEFAEFLKKRFNIGKETKILEIGSNDGTLLSFLKEYTPNVLGVDPAENLIQLNKDKEVNYIPKFLNTSTASVIMNQEGKFDLIAALNVVPHTPDVVDLLKAVRILLKDEGTFIMEGVYALETILKGEFDTIYHEHVYTFSLNSLISTFRMAGLKVIDLEKIPTQGISLRVIAKKDEFAQQPSDFVKTILDSEKKLGLTNAELYNSVNSKVEKFRKDIRIIIDQEKERNGKLIGLGAPARGVVILNYCNITDSDIDYIVDDTVLKQGKLVPGVHIPVKSTTSLIDEKRRGFILLSWNYKNHFVSKLKQMFPSFRLIIPFPELEVIDYNFK